MTFGPRLSSPAVALPGLSVPLPFAEILDSTDPALKYAAVLEPYSANAGETVTLYLADQGFTTDGDDSPAHTHFKARLVEPIEWSRRTSGDRLGGRSEFRSGRMRFTGVDRAIGLDGDVHDLRTMFAQFALDGRQIEVRAVTERYDTGMPLFRGTATDWARARGGEIEVQLRGTGYLLDVPVLRETYAGTGGLEGDFNTLHGKRKPLALGSCFNASPVLVKGGVSLLYQVSVAACQAITAVRIGGIELTNAGNYPTTDALEAATLVAGQYATCLDDNGGWFRLGDTPGATVTCDVEGGVFDGVYETLPGDLIRRAATTFGPQLAASLIDDGSLRTLNSERPWNLGRYFGLDDQTTVAEFLDEIVNSIEGSWGDTRTGLLHAFAIRQPGPSAALTIGQGHVEAGSWEWLEMPSGVRPALREVAIGYARNWTPGRDLAGGIANPLERQRLEERWSVVTGSQDTARHLEAKTLRVDTLLADQEGAEALRDALMGLYDGLTRRVAWTSSHRALRAAPGLVVSVTHPEERLENERVRLTGVVVTASDNRVQLEGIIRDDLFAPNLQPLNPRLAMALPSLAAGVGSETSLAPALIEPLPEIEMEASSG